MHNQALLTKTLFLTTAMWENGVARKFDLRPLGDLLYGCDLHEFIIMSS